MTNEEKQLFHIYPPFRNNRIRVAYLSPQRRVYIEELIHKPLSLVLHFSIFFAAVELFLQHYGRGTLRVYFPHITLPMVLSYTGGFFILLFFEKKSRYSLTRGVFGTSLNIIFKKDEIIVCKGFSRKSYSRNLGLSFSATPIDASVLPVYKKGRNFNLVISNHRPVKIAEIWDIKLACRLVNNCNAALRVTQGFEGSPDLDPRELALQS